MKYLMTYLDWSDETHSIEVTVTRNDWPDGKEAYSASGSVGTGRRGHTPHEAMHILAVTIGKGWIRSEPALHVTERPATAEDVALGFAQSIGDLMILDADTGALIG